MALVHGARRARFFAPFIPYVLRSWLGVGVFPLWLAEFGRVQAVQLWEWTRQGFFLVFFTGVLNFWVCRQNEKQVVPTDVKVDFINRLSRTGLRSIEATSFVSAKWVPQMGDNAEVMARIRRQPGVSYPVLTPNMKGFESALEAGATEVAIFAAASDGFSMKNINCNVMESFERFRPVCQAAIAAGVKVRGCVGVTAVGALR